METQGKSKLIYSMLMSLDGYTEDKNGKFGWGMPEDEEVHAFVNERGKSLGTYLYGRRMYDTMVFWETADKEQDMPKVFLDYARQWQAAEKIVFSKTLHETKSERTKIEREFDPEAIREMKASSGHDISVDGPELAGQAIKAGLVDEFQLIICPVIVGGGKRFFPDNVDLKLQLLEEKQFASGIVFLRYAVVS